MKKTYVLTFSVKNTDIFEALKNGEKKVETRAATKRYSGVRAGDTLEFKCAGKVFTRKVLEVQIFKSMSALLKCYSPETINPSVSSKEELRKMYYSFPGYREKIKKHGLVAFEL